MGRQSSRRFLHRRTKAEKRERLLAEGKGHVAENARSAKERRWLRRQLIRKYGGRCVLCGEQVVLQEGCLNSATIDHVIPLSKGGADTINNMQLACAKCNHDKGDSIEIAETASS